jgi:hypothetical protein
MSVLQVEEESRNLETYYLIWLDDSLDNSEENLTAQQHLRASINHLLILQDHQLCFQFIQSLSNDDRVILIVNHQFGLIIIPQITELRQIISIYVYSSDEQAHEHWIQHFAQVN